MPTNEKILKFIDSICENVKYKSIHKSISNEIENHILESVEVLKEEGINEGTAIDKAIEQMGNPKAIGKELDKVHRPKSKVLKYIKTIVLIMIIIFVISTIRNMIIILSLQNKISIYEEKKNVYAKTSTYQGTSWQTTEYYGKDNSYLYSLTNKSKYNNTKLTKYSADRINVNMYIEVPEDKIVIIGANDSVPTVEATPVINYVKTDSFKTLLLASIGKSIKSAECNGKECYYITNVFSSDILYTAGNKHYVYIEKETGLPVRAYNGTLTTGDNGIPIEIGEMYDIVVDYVYKFDIVIDEYIIEPDITQYRVVEQ